MFSVLDLESTPIYFKFYPMSILFSFGAVRRFTSALKGQIVTQDIDESQGDIRGCPEIDVERSQLFANRESSHCVLDLMKREGLPFSLLPHKGNQTHTLKLGSGFSGSAVHAGPPIPSKTEHQQQLRSENSRKVLETPPGNPHAV